MVAFLIRRFVGFVFVVLAVTFLTFMIGHLAPGDPIQSMMGIRQDPAEHARLMHLYGLDRPLLVQFVDYVWRIVRYGDFGMSFRYEGRPVMALLGSALPVTLTIGLLALIISTVVGVVIGVLAATRQNRAFDRASMVTMLALYSVPSFVLIPLILVVDIWLQQHNYPSLPVANWGTVQQAILPVLVLAAGGVAYIARLTRTTMVGVLGEDFIRTARSKGLPRRRVVGVHALRPSLLPVVTFLGPAIAGLVTGTFVVENIFNIPGVGFAAVTSIQARDYPVVQGATIIIATMVVLMNLIADILYRVLDPRIQE
jgi:peptide/nickel transport system permease protein/oligopeptide transport system permease protein